MRIIISPAKQMRVDTDSFACKELPVFMDRTEVLMKWIQSLSYEEQKMDALEKKIEEYEAFQSEIQKLEAYYTSQQWKDDYAMDEAGTFPEKLKRGVLSQDGIWNLLERNRELIRRLGISEVQGHDDDHGSTYTPEK